MRSTAALFYIERILMCEVHITFMGNDSACDRESIQVSDMLTCVVRQCYIFCEMCYKYENKYVSLTVLGKRRNHFLYVRLSVCLSVCLSACLSVCLILSFSLSLSLPLSVYMSVCFSVSLPFSPSPSLAISIYEAQKQR